MRFFVTSDTNEETKIGASHYKITASLLEFFKIKTYHPCLQKVVIVIMCRNPNLKFKQRVSYKKSEKNLSFDVMMDYYQALRLQDDEKAIAIVTLINGELKRLLCKYIKNKKLDPSVMQVSTDFDIWADLNGFSGTNTQPRG